jgi:hypothetical protein
MKDWQTHRKDRGDSEEVIAAAVAMVRAAPWCLIDQLGPVAKWEPMIHGCDQEHESAVCIRFLQVRPSSIDKMRTRLVIRKELVEIVNEIQRKCWTEHENTRLEEVDFLSLINADGKMEGMVTLARRKIDKHSRPGPIGRVCTGNDDGQQHSERQRKLVQVVSSKGPFEVLSVRSSVNLGSA